MNILSATLATVSSFFARKLDTPRRELAERAAENVFLGRRDLRGRTEPRTHIAEVPTPALGGNGRPAAEQRPEAPVPRRRVRKRLNIGVGGYTPVPSPASHSERSQDPRPSVAVTSGIAAAPARPKWDAGCRHNNACPSLAFRQRETSPSARQRTTAQSTIRLPTEQESD